MAPHQRQESFSDRLRARNPWIAASLARPTRSEPRSFGVSESWVLLYLSVDAFRYHLAERHFQQAGTVSSWTIRSVTKILCHAAST